MIFKPLLLEKGFFMAVILLQTPYFKFTGAPVSVYNFFQKGVESYGRVGLAVIVLIMFLISAILQKDKWMTFKKYEMSVEKLFA